MATYNYITLAQAKAQLAMRLYDPTMQFWTAAELGDYILESLRTWNALTGYWRSDFTFPPVALTTWYDIPSLANSTRPITQRDTDIYRLLEYHLLEPATGVNPWTGSSQFSASDLIDAVNRCQDELLSLTGCTVTQRNVSAIAGRIELPDTVIDVRRMAYLPTTLGTPYSFGAYSAGLYGGTPLPSGSVVWPEDTWAEQSFNRDYTIRPAGTPSQYLMTTQPPISFDTDRPPAFAGSYDLLTVESGNAFGPTVAMPLSVPDDWAHVVKWGALADLLTRESNARDPLRAKYASQRYRMGVKLLSAAPAILAARLGNVPLDIDAVRSADLYRTGWQAEAPGQPNAMLTSGLNRFALAPIPDAGTYSAMLTVVRNAPVPVADGDPVQVSRDDLDAVLDYAQHLAAVKMGGAEFTATMPLFSGFLDQAETYGLKLAEIAEFTSTIFGQSSREDQVNPRLAPAPEAA